MSYEWREFIRCSFPNLLSSNQNKETVSVLSDVYQTMAKSKHKTIMRNIKSTLIQLIFVFNHIHNLKAYMGNGMKMQILQHENSLKLTSPLITFGESNWLQAQVLCKYSKAKYWHFLQKNLWCYSSISLATSYQLCNKEAIFLFFW